MARQCRSSGPESDLADPVLQRFVTREHRRAARSVPATSTTSRTARHASPNPRCRRRPTPPSRIDGRRRPAAPPPPPRGRHTARERPERGRSEPDRGRRQPGAGAAVPDPRRRHRRGEDRGDLPRHRRRRSVRVVRVRVDADHGHGREPLTERIADRLDDRRLVGDQHLRNEPLLPPIAASSRRVRSMSSSWCVESALGERHRAATPHGLRRDRSARW